MKNYHITTKIALILNCVMAMCLIVAYLEYENWIDVIWDTLNAILLFRIAAIIGFSALILYIIGQVKQSTKLGILLIILNVLALFPLLRFLLIYFIIFSM